MFEIETGYFIAAAGAYNADDLPLMADTGATVAVPPSGAGNVTLATSAWTGTVDILGVTIAGGLQNVTTTNSEAAPSGNPPLLQTLLFVTKWLPNR